MTRPGAHPLAQHTPLHLSRCFGCQPMQMYIDSKWFGQAPDGDQYVAKLLRESLEELFHRYKVSFSCVCALRNGSRDQYAAQLLFLGGGS